MQRASVDTLVTQIETYLKSKNLQYAVSDDNDPTTIKTNITNIDNDDDTKSKSKSNRLKTASFKRENHMGPMRSSYYTDDGETDQSIICVEHVMIEDQITSVTDLLQLCEKYKLAENVRYNIDMHSLHKICPYLRELNNMIGMQSIKTTVLDQIIYFIQKLHLPPTSDVIDGLNLNDAAEQLPPICCIGPAMINSNPFLDSSATSSTMPLFKMADGSGIVFHFKNPFSFGGGDVEQIYSNTNTMTNSNSNTSKNNSGKPASTSTTASSSTSASSGSPNQNTPLGGGAGTIASIFANMNISGGGSGGSNPFSSKSKSGNRSSIKQSASSNRIPTGDFMHTVLYGPPGTGKTEVAKILGNIFCHLGILKANTFKKVTRSDLIAGYLGQTAIKTREVIDSAIGGVLFIDEAYALGNTEKRDSFSKECIDTLCEALSDHKHELMVIIAGYEKELTDCFFSYNEGLSSRFTWRYKIDNYSAIDLRKIFEKIVRDNRWTFKDVDSVKDAWFKEHYDYFKYFGRDIEVFFTKTKIAHSRRVFCRPTEQRRSLNMKDLETGFELFSQNEDVKSRGYRFNGLAATLYL